MLRILKNWTLPISMLTGVVMYFVYTGIHALDGTHQAVSRFIEVFQPLLLFTMLFVSFCKVSPRELKPRRWMLKLLTVQVLSFVGMGLFIILFPQIPGRVVIESAMICMICPTATAASVVTAKLQGNPSLVVSYTCLINLAASVAIPSVVSFLHEGRAELGFIESFALIMGKVFPLLILPLLSAWFVRYMMPRFHRRILACKNLAFNLWAVALTLAIGITVKAIVHSHESLLMLTFVALASLVTCVLQFYLGHSIGLHHHEAVAGTQSLGQKNTIFAIWMGYTFMNPVTAMAGGFYSVWHNIINSWQLWQMRKKTEMYYRNS